jgi:ERCC4-type nuclease
MTTTAAQAPIVVCVDDREASAATIAHLESNPGVQLEIRRLNLGDYMVDGRILFERKTLSDLADSIIDGRLFDQGIRLASQSLVPVIILEGRVESSCNGMRREAIQGALITLTLVLGIPLLRSKDPEESVQLMLYAAEQARRVGRRALPRQGKRPRGKRRKQLALLQELPGIGPERAARLLACFGSIANVVNASHQELCGVPGIGSVTASAIRALLS